MRLSIFLNDEQKLIKGLKSGRSDAQQRLYEWLADKMMAVCLRYTRDSDEAADVLQEGFIRVFNKIDTFKEEGSLEGWVRRVITNVAIRNYQKNAKLHVAAGIEEAEREFAGSSLDDDHAAEELLEMVRQLPDGYRMVFNLYAIEGYSHEEIAELLEISIGTSKSQLSRARQALQRMLEKENMMLKYGTTHA